MSILKCQHVKSMVVETTDDTIYIIRRGPDLFEVKFEGYDEVDFYNSKSLEQLFAED